MLTLERMEISGFKSFSDRTEVRFPMGITAVVGPNGCGKSNIGDAINWVLGEQSPKMLRGKQMADVIFAGSEARKAVGLAEVSLHLRGAEGMGACENGNLVVTRRLFRSGESEYLLNGKRTRLKDIQDLLEQGHVGARTYATIEQGRIDQILNAKPKERRLLIEDAAGVAGYKHKRRLTELKLEATQANLLRVHDIVVEVERQIRSLKRQAGRARRYRRLRDELRNKERVLFAVRSCELDVALRASRRTEDEARTAEAEGAATLSRQEVQLVEERARLESANKNLREAADRLHRVEIEIDRQQGLIRTCGERIVEAEENGTRQSAEADALSDRLSRIAGQATEQQERVERITGEVERIRTEVVAQQARLEQAQREQRGLREGLQELRAHQFKAMDRAVESRNRLRGTEEDLRRNTAQRERLDAECNEASSDLTRLSDEKATLQEQRALQNRRIDELRGEYEKDERRLADLRGRLAEGTDSLAGAREAEKSASARLATLEDVATRFAGVSDGVRALLAGDDSGGVEARGVVADFIEAAAEVETAAEGYLETFLPTVIVDDDSEVCRAAHLLRSVGAGRTSLISRSQPAGALAVGTSPNGHGELPAEVLSDRRVIGRLRDKLTLRTSANGFIHDRLGDALVVDTLETALELHRAFPATDYLTAQGDVVYASGVVQAGGKPGGDHGLLAHQRKMRVEREQVQVAFGRVAEMQDGVEALRGEVARAEETLHERRQSLDEAQRRLALLEMQATRTAEDRERTDRRSGVLADEVGALRQEAETLRAAVDGLGPEVESAEAECRRIQDDLDERTAAWERHEEHLHHESEETARGRETLAAHLQRQEAAESERQRHADAVSELEVRIATAGADAESSRSRIAEARELQAATEETLARGLEERSGLARGVAELEQEIQERERTVGSLEGTARDARNELERLRETSRQAELERTRAESSRDHLDDLCRQELGIPATQAEEEARAADVELEEVEVEALEAEIEGVKGAIEKIGPVNMTAIEEFTELEERHGFLTSQRQDLERSMESLKETIRRINRSSRERFTDAFEAIRKHYQEIYTLLFNGGRADLRLEEGEDVLECGIEILAQPPGKRLSNINLLSGGEKALSAIALLFAVFRFQPSPFCLLDEVDAALDEANVGRFARMLTEYAQQTQFIIVTHNKLTMEAADLLYGVTMEEPGVSRLLSLQMA